MTIFPWLVESAKPFDIEPFTRKNELENNQHISNCRH